MSLDEVIWQEQSVGGGHPFSARGKNILNILCKKMWIHAGHQEIMFFLFLHVPLDAAKSHWLGLWRGVSCLAFYATLTHCLLACKSLRKRVASKCAYLLLEKRIEYPSACLHSKRPSTLDDDDGDDTVWKPSSNTLSFLSSKTSRIPEEKKKSKPDPLGFFSFNFYQTPKYFKRLYININIYIYSTLQFLLSKTILLYGFRKMAYAIYF